MAFMGVDLHTNSFTIRRLEADGSERFETFPLSGVAMDRFCPSLGADDLPTVEATGNTAWFRDQVRPCVGRVVTVNSRRFDVIRKSANKIDRNDARSPAFFPSKDMLPETLIKSDREAEPLSPVQTRDLVVRHRTMVVNKIHAIFVRRGLKLKKAGLTGKKSLPALDFSRFTPVERIELNSLRRRALSAMVDVKELDAAIEETAEGFAGHEGLTSIKGIGARSAAVLLAGIGNVDDFPSTDKLASYLGIVPRVSQSNETDRRGGVTKRGNKLMRTTPVQCTLVAICHSAHLNAFHRRIKARRGSGKAIIAPARKFLVIIYDTLKNGWVFEDFAAFEFGEGRDSPRRSVKGGGLSDGPCRTDSPRRALKDGDPPKRPDFQGLFGLQNQKMGFAS